jgi:flagellar biosynthesis protein FliQ
VAKAGSKGTVQTIRDLWALLVAYARQETVDPLKSLGRSLGWGLLGSVLLAMAALFASLSVLRLLQDETDVFNANLSWLPYLVVAVLMLAVTAVAVMTISRASQRRRSNEERP